MNTSKLWLPVILLCLALTTGANARSTPREVELDARARKQLSRFLQDIVSTYPEDFAIGKVPHKVLVNFGLDYVALRQPDRYEDVKHPYYGYCRVPGRYVAAAVSQFFSKKLRHRSITRWQYKDGYYYGDPTLFEQLDPEKISKFKLFNHGHGRYVAYVNFVDSMATVTSDSQQEVIVKSRLTLKRVTSRGQSRYILIGYKSLTPRL